MESRDGTRQGGKPRWWGSAFLVLGVLLLTEPFFWWVLGVFDPTSQLNDIVDILHLLPGMAVVYSISPRSILDEGETYKILGSSPIRVGMG